MILAIAIENNSIATHYAHSERFDLYETSEKDGVQFIESIPYAPTSHLESFEALKNKKVTALVVDMVGDETFEHLTGRNIDVYYGQKGFVDSFIHEFIEGKIPLPKAYVLDDEKSCKL